MFRLMPEPPTTSSRDEWMLENEKNVPEHRVWGSPGRPQAPQKNQHVLSKSTPALSKARLDLQSKQMRPITWNKERKRTPGIVSNLVLNTSCLSKKLSHENHTRHHFGRLKSLFNHTNHSTNEEGPSTTTKESRQSYQSVNPCYFDFLVSADRGKS